jgi:hypothetical protein
MVYLVITGLSTVDINVRIKAKIEVKSSRYRPGVSQRVPGSLGSQIFMTFGT